MNIQQFLTQLILAKQAESQQAPARARPMPGAEGFGRAGGIPPGAPLRPVAGVGTAQGGPLLQRDFRAPVVNHDIQQSSGPATQPPLSTGSAMPPMGTGAPPQPMGGRPPLPMPAGPSGSVSPPVGIGMGGGSLGPSGSAPAGPGPYETGELPLASATGQGEMNHPMIGIEGLDSSGGVSMPGIGGRDTYISSPGTAHITSSSGFDRDVAVPPWEFAGSEAEMMAKSRAVQDALVNAILQRQGR